MTANKERKTNLNYRKGRKKWRQEADDRIANYDEKEKAEHNDMKIGCLIALVILVIIFFLITGKSPRV
jgi:Flp pilus assembly protein TadB